MSASLVGSEMCIRDRILARARGASCSHQPRKPAPGLETSKTEGQVMPLATRPVREREKLLEAAWSLL
eukprot:4123988-Alexandrium_andersonii.AAC.1